MNICNALVLNKNKIYSNLEQRDIELQYCGYRINLNTKEIWLNWNLTNVNVNHQFKLWYDSMYYQPNSYLSEVMKFRSLNFFFSKIVFNTNYNYEESILKFIFKVCFI
ncbi:hypothetical protein HHI36_017248 [Cryptolaemus montrouzieri]|uniref:Uncharacterized protein n=1 Tax=Cryptolaemus montrouzieri TaxID=559131 RepID=A0ABD2NN68_9CUCU